LVGTLQQILLG